MGRSYPNVSFFQVGVDWVEVVRVAVLLVEDLCVGVVQMGMVRMRVLCDRAYIRYKTGDRNFVQFAHS